MTMSWFFVFMSYLLPVVLLIMVMAYDKLARTPIPVRSARRQRTAAAHTERTYDRHVA
jgi:preprotein translocase subunit SecY